MSFKNDDRGEGGGEAVAALIGLVLTVGAILIIIPYMMSSLQIATLGAAFQTDQTNTNFQENKNSTQLEKYMWFKQQAANIDGLNASIMQETSDIAALDQQYNTYNVTSWLQVDRDHYYKWTDQKQVDIKTYNQDVSDYNARMVEANWAYCNVGAMPQGLEGYPALPKEYRVYITN